MGGIDFHDEAAEWEGNVSKPWGDSSRYDVSVEDEGRFRRVQVKSTDAPRGDGRVHLLFEANADSLLPD
jgi:PD-(D/E)XK endonuclease